MVSACGPVQYMADVSGRATAAVEQARREGAETHAPYELTAASEYLKKAREEASYSQWQSALEFGATAEQLAYKALGLARERAGQPGSQAVAPAAPADAKGPAAPPAGGTPGDARP